MEKDYKYGALFAGFDVSDEEKSRVAEEFNKLGIEGPLTFDIERSDEGWSAVCNEIPAIIAGNSNPSPLGLEIEAGIREAIFAAFNVKLEEHDVESPYASAAFSYSAS